MYFFFCLNTEATKYTLDRCEKMNLTIYGKVLFLYIKQSTGPSIALWYRNLYQSFQRLKISLHYYNTWGYLTQSGQSAGYPPLPSNEVKNEHSHTSTPSTVPSQSVME